MNGRTLFELIGAVDERMLEHSEWTAPKKGRGPKLKKLFVLTAAVIAALAITMTAAAVGGGANLLDLIQGGFSRNDYEYDVIADQNLIRSQLDKGQWAYLNGKNIAVIVPESPVRILLSGDGGQTWRESIVTGSDRMEFWGEPCDEAQYYGGFIGFFGEGGGYLVLTGSTRMNNQPMRIYLTGDGGNTWSEIGSPYGEHASVLTGAGFSTPEIGFISYRYYEDFGPDIWWTSDGGDSWQKLPVAVPEQYDGHGRTPLSPVFDGREGVYPIAVTTEEGWDGEMFCLYSHDYGLTWEAGEPPAG